MVYVNNAATSFPKPAEVHAAVLQWMCSVPGGSARDGSNAAAADLVADTRAAAAALLGVTSPTDVFFTSGATASLNTVIRGLPLAGRHVVTTAAEHNSMLRPLVRLQQSAGTRLSIVDGDADGHVPAEAIAAALRDDTALVAVTHCSNVTGAMTDVAAVTGAAHARGALVLVDASQSAGAHAVDVGGWGADFVACAGHKSLFGLPGTGLLYVRPGVEVEPLATGGTGIWSDRLEHPVERPLRHEAGTPNLPGIAALRAGIAFVQRTGPDTIRARVAGLVDRAWRRLADHPAIRVLGRSRHADGRLLCLSVAGTDPGDAAYVLDHAYGIIVRAGLHCAPLVHRSLGTHPAGTLRISPSWFTTEDEMEAVADAVIDIAQGAA
jgi:cysteine desulfurase family protein